MKSDFSYQLDKTSKKFICPSCGKRKFVRYRDSINNQYLPDRYGRCDREVSCGYHVNPYIDRFTKDDYYRGEFPVVLTRPKPPQTFVPIDILKATMKTWDGNIFITNLLNRVPFPYKSQDIEKIISMYYIGTITRGTYAGAVTFPFIDTEYRIRAIQVKLFDLTSHTIHTSFIHSLIESRCRENSKPVPGWLQAYKATKNEWGIVTCLFGEHLLKSYPSNPIALVEAPKTAIIGTLHFGFPEYSKNLLWLAVYNLSSLTKKKCEALTGRNVYLFPDLSIDGKAYNLWSLRAKELETDFPGTRFVVSDFLESAAGESQKGKGLDIADYLFSIDWKKFRDCEKSEFCEVSKTKNQGRISVIIPRQL